MNIKKKILSAILSLTVSFSFIVTFMISPIKAEAAVTFTDEDGIKYQVVKACVYDKEEEDYTEGTCMVIGATAKVKKISLGESVDVEKGEDILTYKIVSIKKGAFKKNTKITSFTLTSESDITAIPDNCFTGCKKLAKVELNNDDIKKIGKNAFKDCKKLSYITIKSDKITKVKSIGKDAFKNTKKNIKVEGSSTKQSKKYVTYINKRGAKKAKYVKVTKVKEETEDEEEEDEEEDDEEDDDLEEGDDLDDSEL